MSTREVCTHARRHAGAQLRHLPGCGTPRVTPLVTPWVFYPPGCTLSAESKPRSLVLHTPGYTLGLAHPWLHHVCRNLSGVLKLVLYTPGYTLGVLHDLSHNIRHDTLNLVQHAAYTPGCTPGWRGGYIPDLAL